MASYPTAVKTFTSKSDGAGNRIFAAHINDLQDEVTAMQDGLLNGTAPVNSSRVTAASVSVAGNSTIGGALTVAGDSTIAGALFVYGTLNVQGASTFAGGMVALTSVQFSGEKSTVLSTGDTHNLSAAGVRFIYVQTNSSGSTLTGMAAVGNGQVVSLYNAGPSAVLGLKNSSGSVSSNQFQMGSDTTVAVGYGVTFYKSATTGKWIKV